MLVSYGNQQADTLYYEVLDLPLEEFEKVKSVKVRQLMLAVFSHTTISIPAQSVIQENMPTLQ